ncbi:hypothetical protein J2Z37_002958, partial [Ammoniphilus resinae]|nr:hypothetical protein [Ammoniphilus resinae]
EICSVKAVCVGPHARFIERGGSVMTTPTLFGNTFLKMITTSRPRARGIIIVDSGDLIWLEFPFFSGLEDTEDLIYIKS